VKVNGTWEATLSQERRWRGSWGLYRGGSAQTNVPVQYGEGNIQHHQDESRVGQYLNTHRGSRLARTFEANGAAETAAGVNGRAGHLELSLLYSFCTTRGKLFIQRAEIPVLYSFQLLVLLTDYLYLEADERPVDASCTLCTVMIGEECSASCPDYPSTMDGTSMRHFGSSLTPFNVYLTLILKPQPQLDGFTQDCRCRSAIP